jgi:SagB-type dehydrogenase family enzyme
MKSVDKCQTRGITRTKLILSIFIWAMLGASCQGRKVVLPTTPNPQSPSVIQLPEPLTEGAMSLEQTFQNRRSVRTFTEKNVEIEALSQLLWATQGVTNERGYRTAPSAGALYPLELYIVTEEGVYHYLPEDHALETVKLGDVRESLHNVALRQAAVLDAPLVFVLTAVYERTETKYGPERSPRYVHLETGHAAQNLLLQAVALDLGAVPIGAFFDIEVQEVLGLPSDHEPLYLIPVGHPE